MTPINNLHKNFAVESFLEKQVKLVRKEKSMFN